MAKESQLSWSPLPLDDEISYWESPGTAQDGGPEVPYLSLWLLIVCGGLALLGTLGAVFYVLVIQ